GLGHDRVAVHHHLAVVAGVVEKRLANPQRVLVALLLEGDARADAGMEIIIAFDMPALEPAQEREVPLRQIAAELLAQMADAREVGPPLQRTHAVAVERRPAAVHEPARPRLRLLKEAEHEFLVVPHEVDALEALERRVEQEVDHLARLQAAVDIVAEIDDASSLDGTLAGVLSELEVKRLEKVGAAVDIADRVDARARRNAEYPLDRLRTRTRREQVLEHAALS